MTTRPFTLELREDILRRIVSAEDEYQRVLKDELERNPEAMNRSRMNAARALIRVAKADYADGLWQVVMATCPFCNVPLARSFDPFDMNGSWWWGVRPNEQPACAHYAFFRGAVSFETGRPPCSAPGETARPGPEVPYVIPAKLEMQHMVAVIGELTMEPGWKAYAISYFADPLPAAERLTSNWCNKQYNYRNSKTGEPEWDFANDEWDFTLEPWIKKGKLLFCEPGSGNTKLAPKGAICPYVNLPGRRTPLEIEGNQVRESNLPDGAMISPFE